MDALSIGQEIQKLRKERGLTQEELAHKTGLSTRTIQRIENGETDARTYTLGVLAKALGVSIEYFTKDAEEKAQMTLQKKSRDRRWLGLLHVSGLFCLLVPPLIIWLWKKDDVTDMDVHGKDVLNFQISMWIYLFSGSILVFLAIGLVILPLLGLFSTAVVVINTLRVLNDSPYKYPLSINFLNQENAKTHATQ